MSDQREIGHKESQKNKKIRTADIGLSDHFQVGSGLSPLFFFFFLWPIPADNCTTSDRSMSVLRFRA